MSSGIESHSCDVEELSFAKARTCSALEWICEEQSGQRYAQAMNALISNGTDLR